MQQQQKASSGMIRAGILGGGQLGRMLLQAAVNYPVETWVLELDPDCPAAHLCHHFVHGDIKDYEAVLAFGKNLDVLTIEIEQVNEEALFELKAAGVTIIPDPEVLRTIRHKILQKEYYRSMQLPSPEFHITRSREELIALSHLLPAVHKISEGGYDGRGVQVLRTEKDLAVAFDAPSVLESMIDIETEIAVIVAVNQQGAEAVYDPVEMRVDPALNQLDYQLAPAQITTEIRNAAIELALKVVRGFKTAGIFAVEMFIDKQQQLWINETAPRVHNSGHHTIEACNSSQFDMLWRILLNYPVGSTSLKAPAALINLTGAPGESGTACYEGINVLLSMSNASLHVYGKKETRPGRKMGHVTLLENNLRLLEEQAHQIKNQIRIKAG